MEQFCRALHPDLDLSPTCLSWFRQATDHCTELIMQTKLPGSYFWSTVKNLIFPVYHNELLNQKIPISIHPNRLSAYDCQSLFLDIVNDYIKRAPRYATEAATNVLLWQILYSLMGIMTLGSFLVSTIFAYQRFGKTLRERDPLIEAFTPERRKRACINRTMRIAKYELQRLRVSHVLQPEEVFAPDGTHTLVLKISSKLSFVDQLVSSSIYSTGRLYRLQGKGKPDFKKEAVSKVMRFLNNYSRKLRLLLVFDEDPVYMQRRRKSKSPAKPIPAPRPKPASPASAPLFKSGLAMTRSMTVTRSHSPPLKTGASFSPQLPTQIPRNNFGRRSSMLSLRK